MPVETIHALIGTAYLIAWLVIGQFAICGSTVKKSGSVSQRP